MPAKRQVDVENSEVVKRDDYTQVLKAIIAAGFCPFCEKHLFKHHQRPVILRSSHWLVTENSWPYEGSRFHFLFIARAHIEATEDMSFAVWTDLQEMYRKVVKENEIRGATLMIRSGDTRFTGASVTHLHAHLISGAPRTKKTEPIRALVAFKR